ncbi:restriction endonuclease subunit S [Escherichia coli]|nr:MULTISPECIES: restriction endonuclease subunit S [Enterobacteriaceae]EEG9006402.1 restriction endonuclease subunit S [Escherichia coli]EEG9051932.1 restriction endonuclease subunit S [Escherichia coli]EEQ1501370.1 restriction endonuclease subunit S [Escherichia coli]EEQ2277585.1 restriction endonuclease subunit S [Escherichia coli]EEQ6822493.1 restriction endonuclease subunit S [Escherichia coli]
MSGSNKHILVPQLRFPEFRDAEEWTTYNLGQLSKIVTERVGDNDCIPYTITSGVGLISQQEKLGRTIAGNSLKNYILLQHNDFAYNKSATKAYPQGYIACYLGHERAAVPNSIFTCFRPTPNLVIPAFLNNLFVANLHGKWLKNRVAVGARANGALQVNNNDLMNVPVPLPTGSQSLSEQKKIADCLSSLDDLLTAEVQKLNVLKEYKKGLLQQLFPREGETLPKIRFPNFQSTTEWKICPLSDFIEEYREKSTYQDEYEVLTSARNGLIRQREYYDNERITERNNVGFNIIPVNYITYRSRSDDRRFYFNENNLGITGIISTYYPVFRINKGINKFFIELLAQYAEYVGKHSVGTSQTVLSLNELRRIKLPIPTEAEQQDIANCLYSFDNIIVAQAQKVKTLKTFKKGLLQQIFPKVNEVIL